MNDPWDVKSVRQFGQYVSFMKINGVPLLPPVLSKECRKEMQYYKLLAKEVEKRISVLQPYIADSDSEDKTDAPELPENEENYDLLKEGMQDGFNVTIGKIPAVTTPKALKKSLTEPHHRSKKLHNGVASNVVPVSITTPPKDGSPKFLIDLSLKVNESGKRKLNKADKSPPIEMPERDYNCVKKTYEKTDKEVITELETPNKEKREVVNFSLNYKDGTADLISDFIMNQDGPSSLSSKSFTGSLNDLHSESIKDRRTPELIRRGSYTLLKPSPQLLAHLEVQSISTGIEMKSISMSESLSNLSTPRKRRSWDLETAKVKWSSMAMELKQKNFYSAKRNQTARSITKKSPQTTPPRAKSLIVERTRRNSVTPKGVPKSEPLPKTRKVPGPISVPTNRAVSKEPISPTIKEAESAPQSEAPTLVSETNDSAKRIKELYEKIQKQQLIQMASLVEKQKREQLLLQQVFEEQNNLLFKQLKSICPKSPIEPQEAWGDKRQEVERGPVSLSQLINHKSPDQSILDSPVSSTLTDTNNYINQCDNVLKKSRDITGSIKKHQTKSQSQNGSKTQSPRTPPDGSRTRTHSPNPRCTLASRRLNYDTSASSDREHDPILTDRTNDTMADLNVTFPSDSDGNYNNSNIHHLCGKEMKTSHGNSGHTSSGMHSTFHTDSAIRNMERTIQNSINNTRQTKSLMCNPPTAKQVRYGRNKDIRAAASRIVAVAKGYLVRRLMRTERVQATVQTIKDALLCALQLHQDRAGIRGADVDLHRRLIQQITAACYSLHDTFVASSPADRCAMIAADRGRRRSLANRQPPKTFRQTDLMSQSHTGAFPARAKRSSPSAMTQSNYETFSGDKSSPLSGRHLPSPRRRPWR